MVAAAGQTLRACILLGINAGFGNTDCGSLTDAVVDPRTAWIDFPRPKSGVERRFPLWPETAAAIQEAMCRRPVASDEAGDRLCFLPSHAADYGLLRQPAAVYLLDSGLLRWPLCCGGPYAALANFRHQILICRGQDLTRPSRRVHLCPNHHSLSDNGICSKCWKRLATDVPFGN